MKPSHALIVLLWPAARAFLASYPRSGCLSPALASVPDSTTTTTSLEDLRARSVRELKKELESLNISTKDALEKEDLVQRLYQALQSPSTTAAPTKTDPNVLTTPLLLSSLEHDVPVRAQAFPDKEDWKLRPSEQPYCAIRVRVQEQWSTPITLTLLLDTACSGILLKPAVVERHGLAVVTSPVTMTSGGGTASSNSQVTTLSKLSLENCPERTFGSLPAVVQDIGALPQALDGIIGLSFLSQFDTLELNFVNSTVSLYDTEPAAPPAHTVRLGPKAPLHRLGSLGIYAVDTWWGGRGPVRMLVDTGAASTYWSWKGVTDDLKIPRNSPTVQKLPGYMGIMGSDNMASPLTHRIYVSSRMCFAASPDEDSLSLADHRRMAVDIGDLPILQQLRSQGIGGILGLDVLRKADVVRMRCRGAQPYLQLYAMNATEEAVS